MSDIDAAVKIFSQTSRADEVASVRNPEFNHLSRMVETEQDVPSIFTFILYPHPSVDVLPACQRREEKIRFLASGYAPLSQRFVS